MVDFSVVRKNPDFISNNLIDICWKFDISGMLNSVTSNVYKQTGFTPEELKSITWDKIFETSFSEFLKYLANSSTPVEGVLETKLNRKNNSPVCVEVNYCILTENLEVICISRDISRINTLRNELENVKAGTEQAEKVIGEFLANISHEIRTPMNTIIGFSELLSSSITNPKSLAQLKSIQTSSKNLLSLLNQIIDISKLESGHFSLEYKPVSISTMLTDIESFYASKMLESNLTFIMNADNFPIVLMDEIRLRQIILTLVGNARKFTTIGFIKVDARIAKTEAETIDFTIRVEDSGIGIPYEHHEHIFKIFRVGSQKDAANTGVGLGLALVKKLTELMGGTIDFVSEPGKGTTFSVYFKNVKVTEAISIANNITCSSPNCITFKPETILICDDNKENRDLILDLLSASGLTILQATTGAEALNLAQQHIPALILMDLKMPVINGDEVTRILKASEITKHIPVIGLSASLPGEEDFSIFDSFLSKPLDLLQLLDVIKNYLNYSIESSKAVSELKVMNSENLALVLPMLEKEVMPLYTRLMKHQRMDLIEEFSTKLINMAEYYDATLLAEFGKRLSFFSESFDIENIMKLLNEFPDLIEKFRLYK